MEKILRLIDNNVMEKLKGFLPLWGEGSTLNNPNRHSWLQQMNFHKRIFENINPCHILETGTHKGQFSYFCHCLKNNIHIDTFGLSNDSNICIEYLKSIGVNVDFYPGNTVETLTNFIPPYQIDYAWIDGGHEYVPCSSDLKNCYRLNIKHIAVDDYKLISDVRNSVDDFIKNNGYYSIIEILNEEGGICYLQMK